MDRYQELVAELEGKTKLAHRIIEEKPDFNWTTEEVEKFQQDQKELGALGAKVDELKGIRDAALIMEERLKGFRTPAPGTIGHGMPDDGDPSQELRDLKTIGELFTATQEYQQMKGRTNAAFGVDIPNHTLRTQQKAMEFKTTITSSAGIAPFVTRQARVIDYATRRTMVGDLMPNTQINQPSIKYMEETTFTNNAAGVAENASKPESALAWTERTIPVEVIGHYVPITEQQLEDIAGMQSLVDNRLTFMLALAEESALLNGDGNTPNLIGFYNKSGVQTQSGSGIEIVEAIYKSFTKIRATGFAEPDGVAIHPNDWEAVRLMRADGATGVYLFGNPSEAGPETIWGKRTAITTAATENTALAGDFGLYSELFRKGGIRVDVGRINDDLVKNKMTVRVEERVALAIYRATAFCKITNI